MFICSASLLILHPKLTVQTNVHYVRYLLMKCSSVKQEPAIWDPLCPLSKTGSPRPNRLGTTEFYVLENRIEEMHDSIEEICALNQSRTVKGQNKAPLKSRGSVLTVTAQVSCPFGFLTHHYILPCDFIFLLMHLKVFFFFDKFWATILERQPLVLSFVFPRQQTRKQVLLAFSPPELN